jgi:ABC-type uncharacterized transport system involved in gliding motility auxiliary subunit
MEKYNLALQNTIIFLDDPSNYQDLHSGPPNYQNFEKCPFWLNIPIIPLSRVIFQLKNKEKIKK